MNKVGAPLLNSGVYGPLEEALVVGDLLSAEISEHPTWVGHHVTHADNGSRVGPGVKCHGRDSSRCYPFKVELLVVADAANQVIYVAGTVGLFDELLKIDAAAGGVGTLADEM